MKFSQLTDSQRAQVMSFFQDDIKKKDIFEHDFNSRSFQVNLKNGEVVFNKDF